MPRGCANTGIVLGPRWDNLDGQVAADFLKYFLLPRKEVEARSARWVFCYGCDPAGLGSFEVLSRGRDGILFGRGAAMTLRAIAGLLLLHLFFLGVGAGVLWGLRGWRTWTEFGRLAGLAYLLGIASLTIVLTLALVSGLPFGPPLVLLCGLRTDRRRSPAREAARQVAACAPPSRVARCRRRRWSPRY